MKKYVFPILALVLTTALLTACGCTDSNARYTTAPTTRMTMPTMPSTTMNATQSTGASTEGTHAATDPTMDRGNGPIPDNTTNSTVSTTDNMTNSRSSSGTSRMP